MGYVFFLLSMCCLLVLDLVSDSNQACTFFFLPVDSLSVFPVLVPVVSQHMLSFYDYN